MKILTVIPIQSSARLETLTYFTRGEAAVGALVSVPLRSKNIPALVIESKDASTQKSDLKSLTFSLKKIEKVLGENALGIYTLRAAQKTALFHASTLGNVLSEMMPHEAFEHLADTPEQKKGKEAETIRVQANETDRLAYYRNVIREALGKKQKVLCIAPTIEDVKKLKDTLSHGIAEKTFLLSSHLSKKKRASVYKKITEQTESALLITTPGFSIIPHFSPDTIICEKENSRAWHTLSRPFLDTRIFWKHFSKEAQKTLVLGDTILGYETFSQTAPHPQDFIQLSFDKKGTISLVNMADTKRLHEEDEIISPHLQEAITKSLAMNEPVFLLAARKGYAPSSVCRDCANIISCTTCGSALVLAHTPEGRIFCCTRCNTKVPAFDLCPHCGSSRLTLLGIGTEKVAEVAKELFPHATISICDGSIITSRTQAEASIAEWQSHPKSILIGTELALLYLPETISTVGVVSLDPLLSIPHFEIEEKIAHIILTLIHKTERSFSLQSRVGSHPLWHEILSGNYRAFFARTGEERKRLSLPPFSTFILLKTLGSKPALEIALITMKKILEKENFHILPRKTKNGKEILSILIQKKTGEWPDTNLSETLRRLPTSWHIEVNPKEIL